MTTNPVQINLVDATPAQDLLTGDAQLPQPTGHTATGQQVTDLTSEVNSTQTNPGQVTQIVSEGVSVSHTDTDTPLPQSPAPTATSSLAAKAQQVAKSAQETVSSVAHGVKDTADNVANTLTVATKATGEHLSNPAANMQNQKKLDAKVDGLLDRAVQAALKPRLMAKGIFGIDTTPVQVSQLNNALAEINEETSSTTLSSEIQEEIDQVTIQGYFYDDAVKQVRNKYGDKATDLSESVKSLAQEEYFAPNENEGRVALGAKRAANFLRNNLRIGTVIADDVSGKLANITFSALNTPLHFVLNNLGTSIALVVAYVVRCVTFIAGMALNLLVNGLQAAAVIVVTAILTPIAILALTPVLVVQLFEKLVSLIRAAAASISAPSTLELRLQAIEKELREVKEELATLKGKPTHPNTATLSLIDEDAAFPNRNDTIRRTKSAPQIAATPATPTITLSSGPQLQPQKQNTIEDEDEDEDMGLNNLELVVEENII